MLLRLLICVLTLLLHVRAYREVADDLTQYGAYVQEIGMEPILADYPNYAAKSWTYPFIKSYLFSMLTAENSAVCYELTLGNFWKMFWFRYKHQKEFCDTLSSIQFGNARFCFVHTIDYFSNIPEMFTLNIRHHVFPVNVSLHLLDMVYSRNSCARAHFLIISNGSEILR